MKNYPYSSVLFLQITSTVLHHHQLLHVINVAIYFHLQTVIIPIINLRFNIQLSMARHLNFARTATTNILTSLHVLLFASLFLGILANAAVPLGASHAQTLGKPSEPTNSAGPPLHHFPIHNPAYGSPQVHHARQVNPTFNCAALTGGFDCKDAKDCLFADPDRWNGFIHCDQNHVAWKGYCPMESMIWNDEMKICDYAKEKRSVGCKIHGEKNEVEKTISLNADHPFGRPSSPRRFYVNHLQNGGATDSGKSAAPPGAVRDNKVSRILMIVGSVVGIVFLQR